MVQISRVCGFDVKTVEPRAILPPAHGLCFDCGTAVQFITASFCDACLDARIAALE